MNKIKVAVNVRLGSKTDTALDWRDVRFTPKADIRLRSYDVR